MTLVRERGHDWPARSPDLTCMDYFLWGRLKNGVYSEVIMDREHLINRIQAACETIQNRPEILKKSCSSFDNMSWKMLERGGIFENKL